MKLKKRFNYGELKTNEVTTILVGLACLALLTDIAIENPTDNALGTILLMLGSTLITFFTTAIWLTMHEENSKY